MNIFNNFWLILIACLTLGLAPFTPEPHIWEKIRWVFNGEWRNMVTMHYVDILLHGTPWALLLRLGIIELIRKIRGR